MTVDSHCTLLLTAFVSNFLCIRDGRLATCFTPVELPVAAFLEASDFDFAEALPV